MKVKYAICNLNGEIPDDICIHPIEVCIYPEQIELQGDEANTPVELNSIFTEEFLKKLEEQIKEIENKWIGGK